MQLRPKFDHYNINVLDIKRSIAFYNKALGLNEVKRINAEDGSYVIVYLGDDYGNFKLELTWLRDHTQPYDLGECEFHLCVRMGGDYEKLRQYHKELNCVCFENHEMGLYFIEDPDGYWTEILPQIES